MIGTSSDYPRLNLKSERFKDVYKRQVQKERDEILSATEKDIQKLAPYMEAILKTGSLCALGGEERIKKEKELFGEIKPLIGSEGC